MNVITRGREEVSYGLQKNLSHKGVLFKSFGHTGIGVTV